MSEYVEASSALVRVIRDGRHLDEALGSSKPLVQQICYGALRHFFFYDRAIDLLIDKPLPEKHLDVRLLILTGLYSIDHLKRPAHASVNHVVGAAPKIRKGWAKGLINAVLRRYQREKEHLIPRIQESTEAVTNHPGWLAAIIQQDWSSHPEILTNNNQHAPMTLRVNLSRTTRTAYLELLANNNIMAQEGAFTDSAIILKEPTHAMSLPGFSEGLVSIQDEAPQLAPTLMNLEPGMRVLDACAAPGGKTCHILESTPDISLTAVDRDQKRTSLISDNLSRLQLSGKVVTESLETFTPAESFDRILLDVPCSATGIIRRHPDIKLLRAPEDIDKLCTVQRVLIHKAFELLRPGGELLYSTCSILRQENDQVIAAFLEQQENASLISLGHALLDQPDSLLVGTEFGLQFLPTRDDHDGFYYAALRKAPA
ncbi:MAG: 16S rRNA (cytosine(967)-C(5))-methyltransferase RsmB [Pseudomonadales bacterium]|nr:16S rRNA (cytosine(967)-C(5))-methyltransferase RsmB [Pseudomonadales bacterium]MBO6596594.1 16S rRNA (cytosine(967)-C(5))-methyltransferase RsmB [Pseudomonadales bacterium]MBO6823417.1 16S rRNA (cytosine(967)-C(5))-methyltransferase RsmB [Pseudomonadales bacterium]